jgi:enoyl-[acyl-carrier-protein] reductase (NADH)
MNELVYLTEELLTEWTGLTGDELSIFYLKYKQQLNNVLQYDSRNIKDDILQFKVRYLAEPMGSTSIRYLAEPMGSTSVRYDKEVRKKVDVKNMIKLWESKINTKI